MSLKTVHDIVRDAETNYLSGSTKMGQYVDWSMHDTIETIDAYLNSKHISGTTDSLGREKPFFNIVSAAVNIWYRATDLDRKNIRIMPDKMSNTALAFIATVKLQNWMKEARFGTFLNDWGRTLARYGSAIVKFVEKDGELTASVVPWNRYIADPVQFDAIPRIEKFYMTPAQLRKQEGYDQDMVDALISAVSARKTIDGMQKDNMDDFIEVYEVHGELDTRLLDEEPDLNIEDKEIKYRQQMHVVSYVESEGDKYDDFTLYSGKEKKDPYMLTHLIPEDGRTLAIGAVEYLFEAQWMANHSVKNMKDTLDMASKLIFQTADSKFVGRNVLSAIETGDIFVHKENMPLTRLANDKPDIAAMQNYLSMWQSLGQELTSTPDALRGTTMPSGTPYSLGALLGQEANSLFEIMTENKGLAVEDMMRQYILPHLGTKMDTKDEIIGVLEGEGIAEIDAMYVPQQAIKNHRKDTFDKLGKLLDKPLDAPINPEELPQPFNPQMEEQAVRQSMAPLGNKRSFVPDDLDEKTWKEAFKDFEMHATVEVTNENTDKQAVLTTLSAVLQTIGSNPQILQDPNAKMILGAILTETGRISPIQLAAASAQPAQPMQTNTDALNQIAK
jgi:hypothetical protein